MNHVVAQDLYHSPIDLPVTTTPAQNANEAEGRTASSNGNRYGRCRRFRRL